MTFDPSWHYMTLTLHVLLWALHGVYGGAVCWWLVFNEARQKTHNKTQERENANRSPSADTENENEKNTQNWSPFGRLQKMSNVLA